ncbi:MAG TPA: sigma-70 family RNA polymerase sigma factor [Bryobacteraceae bacterium]|nr:sigma-70 family RNA polymerase sigma factor [Bryobacteraceae bacterium]
MPWANIVEEIRSGREEASELLYTAVLDCARPHLFQSVDPQAVEDHIQEILLIVLSAVRRGDLRDPLCLMGFVRTVTRRQIAVHIRRTIANRRRLISVESAAAPMAPAEQSPDVRLAARERISAVHTVLGHLRARDREILVRFYFEEQDPPTICREMGLTATQFRLYKSRALAKCVELSPRRRGAVQSTKPLRIA